MPRSLQELLAAAGEHNAAMGRGSREGVSEDAVPEEPATKEGVAAGTGEDAGYLTKEEAAKLPTNERITQIASEIQSVYGDEDSGAGVKKKRRSRLMSPVERATTATAGKYQLKVTPVDKN